jgi:hypothetical protein
MQIEVLKDVLLWKKNCQFQLKGCLKHWGDDAESERLGWLLHYLADHEDKLAKALVTLEEQANLGALNTLCIEYIDGRSTLLREAITPPATEPSRVEIMKNVVQENEQILALYRHLESRLPRGHAQQLMFDLAEMEFHQSMQMVNN